MTALDQVKEKLIQLRLKIMAQRLEEVIQQAKEKNRDPLFVLNQLTDAEAEHRLAERYPAQVPASQAQ